MTTSRRTRVRRQVRATMEHMNAARRRSQLDRVLRETTENIIERGNIAYALEHFSADDLVEHLHRSDELFGLSRTGRSVHRLLDSMIGPDDAQVAVEEERMS